MAVSTIGFEEFAAELPRSQTSGLQFINGGSTLIDGVGFDSRIRVVGDEYRVAPPDGPVYGIPSSGNYFISNAESADTDDIILTTNRVLVESWFGRNEFYGFGGGASAVTVTAFGAAGDLDSVSVDLPDPFPDQADPPVRLDSTGFTAFAGQILGYRINRVAIGEFGGQWVADDFRFLDVEDALPPAAPQILQALDDQDPITGVLLSGATTNDATPLLSGMADPGSLVELFADGGSLGSTVADGSGAWSFTPAPPRADGTSSFTAIASNPAGIRGVESSPFLLTIDTVVPLAVRLSGPGSVAEGDLSGGYTVSLGSGVGLGAGRSVSFTLETASGTALEGVDFAALVAGDVAAAAGLTLATSTDAAGVVTVTAMNSSGLDLAAGSALATFAIQTEVDAMYETEETYAVTLGGVPGVGVEGVETVTTSIGDGSPPPVSLTGPASVRSGDVTTPYTVTLGAFEGVSLGAGSSVTFSLVSGSGTALQGEDFRRLEAWQINASSGVALTKSTSMYGLITVEATNISGAALAAGAALATFDIITIDNPYEGLEENFSVTIGDGNVEGEPTVWTEILHLPPISILLSGPTDVVEGDRSGAYTVSLGSGVDLWAGRSVSFTLETAGVTATQGVDFAALVAGDLAAAAGLTLATSTDAAGVVTVTATNSSGVDLAAGSVLATFAIQTTEDGIHEGDENYAVTIGAGAGVSVEGAATQTTAIGDDDPLAVTTPIGDGDPPAVTPVIGDDDPPAVTTTDDQPAPAEAPLPTASVRSTVGTSGPDKIVGGVGDDRLEGLGGDDDLRGRNGDDQLFGGEGDDRQRGGRGKDVVMGDGGDDELSGGRGADRLIGGEGDDLLNGNKGKDLLIGSSGTDRFSLSRGKDVIQDFSLTDPDLIVIPAGKIFSLAEDRDGNVRIDCEGFGTTTLLGVSLAAFQQVNPIVFL